MRYVIQDNGPGSQGLFYIETFSKKNGAGLGSKKYARKYRNRERAVQVAASANEYYGRTGGNLFKVVEYVRD